VAATSIGELPVGPEQVARVIALVNAGEIQRKGGQLLLAELLAKGGDPDALVETIGLGAVGDDDQIRSWCRAALEGREAVAEDVRAGNEKALGALMGPVMGASGGRADPARVRALLLELIRGDGT
jgi:aspartyl-tRNA(Asn)/glutamyl-tRNA(Gln) amidotransferase subunit B